MGARKGHLRTDGGVAEGEVVWAGPVNGDGRGVVDGWQRGGRGVVDGCGRMGVSRCSVGIGLFHAESLGIQIDCAQSLQTTPTEFQWRLIGLSSIWRREQNVYQLEYVIGREVNCARISQPSAKGTVFNQLHCNVCFLHRLNSLHTIRFCFERAPIESISFSNPFNATGKGTSKSILVYFVQFRYFIKLIKSANSDS